MRINTALILCAGFGKRLNPLTLKTPKPLLKINNITILESCINMAVKSGIKKIFLNTFYLNEQIHNFVKNRKFSVNVQIIQESKEILNTGGGILNMTKHFTDNDFLILNPDTIWDEKYFSCVCAGRSRLFFLKHEAFAYEACRWRFFCSKVGFLRVRLAAGAFFVRACGFCL